MYVDLRELTQDDFIKEINYLFIQPIHNEIKQKYLITQFISEILREMGFHGIIYKNTQGKGDNVVSFYSEEFEFVLYTDKMYKALEISYQIAIEEQSYKKYFKAILPCSIIICIKITVPMMPAVFLDAYGVFRVMPPLRIRSNDGGKGNEVCPHCLSFLV
jgi:hypothetical protein